MSNDHSFAMSELTNGQTNAMVKKIGGAHQAREFLRGHSRVIVDKHVIDCDADPFIPLGWELVEHTRDGIFEIMPQEIRRVVYCLQSGGAKAGQVKSYLNGVPGLILNANVLDYLLADTKIIPQDLKDPMNGYQPMLCFWGTEYTNDRRPCIRGLRWNPHRGAWTAPLIYTDLLFHSWAPAAMY